MTDTLHRLVFGDREIVLVGTAHVSRASVDEVDAVIRAEAPDRVGVEIDAGRYRSMTEPDAWRKLDLAKVLKEGRGFLLMANLALSSFQRRLGANWGVKPGDEMRRAIEVAAELGIPYDFCDRDVAATLRRAWAKCGFWSKSKLMATLLSSALTTEKLDESEVEALKNQSELDGMMGELAEYLPEVKATLIDERDVYLAAKIWAAGGKKTVAVVGAGHLEGVKARLAALAAGEASAAVDQLEIVPPPTLLAKALPWLIPAAIVALIVAGFFRSGAAVSLDMVKTWVLWNGSLAALGSLVSLGHPLTILVSFLGAPIATINPFVGIGLFAALTEVAVRKPRVSDMESLVEDVATVRGFYKNRVTRALLVFILSSLGGVIGNVISFPVLAKLVIGG
jgi:pheromone shutdown-related protein TraB